MALVLGIVLGGIGFTHFNIAARAQDATPQPQSQALTQAEDVVSQVGSAVVTVINEQTYQTETGNSLVPAGSGTGFIIDNQGHIVTNWHVVTGGEEFKVIFADGTQVDADLVGSDQVSDLAVVHVDGTLPGTVALGDSDALKPGQPVLAIGSPLGTFTNTVTQGIVSAVNRDFPDAQNYSNLIQHDAAINPGNSGGPLFNFNGEVVGVNTLGIPTAENGEPVQGLFFAIPSNTVKDITAKLISDGKVVYPYFGIVYVPITPDVAAQLGLDQSTGVLVRQVVEGPAQDAGIQEGDIITAIDDTNIDANTSFAEALFQHNVGDTVKANLIRDAKQSTVDVKLTERPDDV